MKAIKIIIALLITWTPLILSAIATQLAYPKVKDTPIFSIIWVFLFSIYLVIQFGYYADKFCKWFDSKLK
jgi:hypothetical protein